MSICNLSYYTRKFVKRSCVSNFFTAVIKHHVQWNLEFVWMFSYRGLDGMVTEWWCGGRSKKVRVHVLKYSRKQRVKKTEMIRILKLSKLTSTHTLPLTRQYLPSLPKQCCQLYSSAQDYGEPLIQTTRRVHWKLVTAHMSEKGNLRLMQQMNIV